MAHPAPLVKSLQRSILHVDHDQLIAQLRTSDPIGVTLALFRTRVYRFSDDLRHYVLAEWLEERFIHGCPPLASTLAYLEACLTSIRATGVPLAFAERIAVDEGFDVTAELDSRATYRPAYREGCEPEQIIFIVGAPRSGTSHLHNLLGYTGRFAYFTTVSCWAWPTRNLDAPGRRLFEECDHSVFDVDNKTTRIIPGLVVPYEAEDLYARAIPTYRHRGGHRYDLQPAMIGNTELLRSAIDAHCHHFGRQAFLTKSPFNSLRIICLENLFRQRARYLHITRPQEEVADSMERNKFHFSLNGRFLTARDAWSTFVAAVEENAPSDRLMTDRKSVV